MTTIISYARQSQRRDDQEDSVSLAYQAEQVRRWAERNGAEVVADYGDLDVPGNIEARDGLDALLAHCRRQRPDAVAVYSISRLARDTYLFLRIVRELDRLGIRLISCTESTDDRTLLIVMGAFAERERVQLSNNVAYAIREQARRGLVTQQPPFGYDRQSGVLLPNDDAPVVRRIFAEYVAGRTTPVIADGLMADGIRSPYGRPHWRPKAVRRILACRTYAGEIAISESRDPAGRIRPAVVTAGLHDPLIDRATWETAQRLLRDATWTRKQDGRITPWLAGHLWCAACGARCYLGVKSRKPNDGGIARWYAKCATHQLASDARAPATCPGQASADLHLIEPVARETLAAALRGVVDAETAYQRATAAQRRDGAEERKQAESRLAKHRDRLEALTEMRISREIDAATFARLREPEDARISLLEERLSALPVVRPLETYRAGQLAITDAADAILAGSDDELRRLVVTIGGRASVDLRDKTVAWSFAPPFDALLGSVTI